MGQTLCTEEQPRAHILPCLAAWRGVGAAIGDKQGHVTCRCLGTCFAEESGSDQGWVLCWQPCAFSWLIFLGEDLPIWVWSWQPISSWCLERTNPKWSPRDWLGGENAGQLSIVVFFFMVYEITAAPRFFKKHWKCLSFISLIYLKHNAVMGKYCYFMILVTHVVLKISVLCDESNAYVLLWRGFEKKKGI